MKNYVVEVITRFNDGEEKILREVGDVFKCTKERYEVLDKHQKVKLIEIEQVEEITINQSKEFNAEVTAEDVEVAAEIEKKKKNNSKKVKKEN